MSSTNSATQTNLEADREAGVSELLRSCMACDDVMRARFIGEYRELLRGAVARKLIIFSSGRPVVGDVDDIYGALLEKILARDFALLSGLREPLRINGWLVSIARNFVIDYFRKHASVMRAQIAVVREEREKRYPSPSEVLMAQ